MKNLQDQIIDNIVFYRKKLGYSQEEFAKKINLTQSQIARIENPNCNTKIGIDRLADIAKALNIDIYTLLKKPDQPERFELNNELLAETMSAIDQILPSSIGSEQKATIVFYVYKKVYHLKSSTDHISYRAIFNPEILKPLIQQAFGKKIIKLEDI